MRDRFIYLQHIHQPWRRQLIHKVVTELLQFAAIMTPNDAPTVATDISSSQKQLEDILPMGQWVGENIGGKLAVGYMFQGKW